MADKARWGPFSFLVSPSKIVPFDNFSTSVTLKADNGNDTSGKSSTNTRGLELQPMTFSTKYMRALGVDPRERYEAWVAQVGNSYPLYIGDKRFGPAKMKLTGVNMSELITNNNGGFLSVTLDVTLQEAKQKATKTSSKSKSSSKSKKTTGSTYKETVEKKKAMNTTAAADERNRKKVTAMEKRLG